MDALDSRFWMKCCCESAQRAPTTLLDYGLSLGKGESYLPFDANIDIDHRVVGS